MTIDNHPDWKTNSTAMYKKGCSRIDFLRKLRSFKVCSKLLEIFYQSVVAAAFFYSVPFDVSG